MSYPKFTYGLKDFGERLLHKKIVALSHFPYIRLHARFLSVRMDVTSRCNLKCMICTRSVEQPASADIGFDMDWKLFLKISREVFPKATELFLSCASEALMAKRFPEMLDVVAEAGIPLVGFTSNGILLNQKMAEKVVSAGVKEIEISFDGAQEATFKKIRGGASMNKVIENVKYMNGLKESLGKCNPEIVFHITLMLSNIDEISGILEIAHSLGVSRVRALHLYPHPSLDLANESLYDHRDLYDARLTGAQETAKKLGLEFLAPPPFGKKQAGALTAGNFRNNRCVFPWTMLRIAPNGDVFPCATWMEDRPFGNLKEKSFYEIWFGPQYRELRENMRNDLPPPGCKHCPTMTEFAFEPSNRDT